MIPKFVKISKVLTLSLALAALLIPSISSGFPTDTNTYQINAVRVGPFDFGDENGPANNPSHSDWAAAPVTEVPLGYEIVASANAQFTFDDWKFIPGKTRVLSVAAIHDGQEILFRVNWEDSTPDILKNDVPKFFDALALLIPYSGEGYETCVPGDETFPSSEPMIHMGMRCDGRDEKGRLPSHPDFIGAKCCPVGIMFWRPDKVEIENIVTNGMGTTLETAETDDPTLFHAWQEWGSNHWTVIMGRAMLGPDPGLEIPPDTTPVGPGGFMVDLVPGGSYDTVFANWDGIKEERNGIKWIGLFGTLIIAP
jgi:hypothetical protein